MQRNYLNGETIRTIYFGGGTPSLLKAKEIHEILDEITKIHVVSKNAEITLEANPDDLTKSYLSSIKKTRINRLSIGVQSFFDEDLSFFSRRHNGQDAENCIQTAQQTGFKNLSIDLIYGFEGLNARKWKKTLKKAFTCGIQHLSAYHLSIDNGTLMYKMLMQGKIRFIQEAKSWEQFVILTDTAKKYNFEHYELSNFCKKGNESLHNSSYWQGKKYLGIGPSAHSYDICTRQWNTHNLLKYIEGIQKEKPIIKEEKLSIQSRYNDYIMLGLRTAQGIDTEYVGKKFGQNYYNQCVQKTSKYLKTNHIIKKENTVKLTQKGMFISNTIMADFFVM